jgi:hypothetical protein
VNIAINEEIDTANLPNDISIEQQDIDSLWRDGISDRRSARLIAPAGIMKNASIDHRDIMLVRKKLLQRVETGYTNHVLEN